MAKDHKDIANQIDSDVSFKDIFENLPIGVIVTDENWQIISQNNAFNHFLKSEKKSLIGKNFVKLDLAKKLLEKELKNLAIGQSFEKTIKSISTNEGSDIDLVWKGLPLQRNGKFNGSIIIVEDIITSIDVKKERTIFNGYFDLLLQNICDYYFITDLEGKIIYSPSNTTSELYKIFSRKIFTRVQDIFKDNTSSVIDELYEKAIEEKVEVSEILLYNSESIQLNLQTRVIPFLNLEQNIPFVFTLLQDVTDKDDLYINRTKEISELRKYQTIVSEVIDALIGIDFNGEINFWNDSAAKIFGYTKSEVFNEFIGKLIPLFTEDYYSKLIDEIKETKTWEGRLKVASKNNDELFINVKIGLVGDNEDRSLVMLCSDVSEQVENEKRFRQSEEHFRNIVTNSHEFICTIDKDGNLTYANPFFQSSFNYNEEEILMLNLKDIIEENYFEDEEVSIESILNNKNKTIEIPLVTKYGNKIYVLASFSEIIGITGEVKYYDAIFTNVTSKKEAEKEFQLTRSVFEVSKDGIAVEVDGKIVLANESLAKIFGYENKNNLIGINSIELVADEDRAKVFQNTSAFISGKEIPEKYEFIGLKLDGTFVDIVRTITAYKNEGILYIVSTFTDVTKENEAKAALKISEERYRSISENINEYMWIAERVNGKMETVFYTQAVEKILSYSQNELLEDKRLWYKIIHPDDVELVIDKLKSVYKNSDEDSSELEYRIINKAGSSRWIKNKISLIRNGNREIQRIYGLVSDITLSKKAEEELKQSAENLENLNETKDRFISIVSHDLRTPFNSILGFTDLLLSDPELSEEKRTQYIRFIQESSKNMLSLVNSLLDWTRLQTGSMKYEPERTNAQVIVTNSFHMLAGSALQKNIELVTADDNEYYIHADENLLLQVFNNLISNAIKFTNKDGQISIGGKHILHQNKIEFSVKDNGLGIREEDLEKLFKVDTKFTTKGTAGERGSGLGLSLCKDIIEKHGGEIRVESEMGKGTTFYFTIPTASSKILLVDNSKKDRVLYSKLIKSIMPKYSVIEAESGEQALSLIKSAQPALVILDHVLPDKSGLEVLTELESDKFRLKPPLIILSSDLSINEIDEYKNRNIDFVFNKPVNLSVFKNAVQASIRKGVLH